MDKNTMIFEGKKIPVFFHEEITGRLSTELINLSKKLPSNDLLADLMALYADFPDRKPEEIIISEEAKPFVQKYGMKKIIEVAKAAQAGAVYMDSNDLETSHQVFGLMYSKIIDVDQTIKAKNNLTTKKKEALKKYIEDNPDMWLDQNIQQVKKDVKNFCLRIELYIK